MQYENVHPVKFPSKPSRIRQISCAMSRFGTFGDLSYASRRRVAAQADGNTTREKTHFLRRPRGPTRLLIVARAYSRLRVIPSYATIWTRFPLDRLLFFFLTRNLHTPVCNARPTVHARAVTHVWRAHDENGYTPARSLCVLSSRYEDGEGRGGGLEVGK